MKLTLPIINLPRTRPSCLAFALSILSPFISLGGQGAASYIDFNSTTAGFGTSVGANPISESALIWDTSNAGTGTTTARPSGTQLTIGASAGDFAGETFSINLDGGGSLQGILLNSTSVNVTLTGTANTHNNSGPNTWTVPAGSILTVNDTRQSFDTAGTVKGLNWNNVAVTFAGAGTINFPTPLAANTATGLQTMNMPGGVINLQMPPISSVSTYGGGFTLTAGTLNFASAGSANAFNNFTNNPFSINGGTIDNTSGSLITAVIGAKGITLGGNFTFTGSSSLSFNTPLVNLTGNRTITVNNNALTFTGPINSTSSTNALTKAGAGTLALLGANTYAGTTTVNTGKLVTTTASIGAGAYILANTSTLDVQVAGAGQTLNTSNLVLGQAPSDSCSLQIDAGSLANPTAPVINATNLAINGTVTINLFGTALTSGTYTILTNAPGNRSGAGSFVLSVSPHLNATLNDDTANNRVTVTLSNPDTADIWDGTASGNWDINNSGNLAWKGDTSGNPTYYIQDPINGNDAVRFTDAATGTTTISLTTSLSPLSLMVSNTASTPTANYTFNGTGKISGTTSLLKQGSGSLTLAGTGGDNFSGGITVGGGSLTLVETGANIAGGLTVSNGSAILDQAGNISGNTTIGTGATVQVGNNDANGNVPGIVTDNGSLIFNRSDSNLAVGTAISGTGTLVNNGSGTVTLTVNNTYSGGSTLNHGTLQVRSASTGNTALGSGDVTINSGATLVGTNADAFGYAGAGHVNPTNIFINGGTIGNLGGSSYRITLPFIVFTGGTITGDPSNTGDASGDYSFGGNGSIASVVTLPSSTTATISAPSISIQRNSTVFNVASGTTPSGVDLLISSTVMNFSGSTAPFQKMGTGVLKLTGANTYLGNTIVSNGVLAMGGSASLLSTQIGVTNGAIFDVSQLASTFTLNPGQTLGGNGLVKGNVIAQSGSTIDASLYGGSTLTFNNNLTMNDSSTNSFQLDTTTAGANSKIVVAGTLDLSGGTSVIQLSYTTLQIGRYHLITYSSKLGGVANLILSGFIPGGRQTAHLDDSTTPNTIDLVVSGASGNLVWLGNGSSNNWDTNNTPDWSNTVSHASDVYFDGDLVTFDDTGSKNPPVNLSGTLQPTSVTFANNTGTYTLSDNNNPGSGKLTGPMSLVKTGSGTAILSETGGDDFDGDITVGGGSLVLSNTMVNLSGAVLVTNGGNLTLAQSGTMSGGLTVNGGTATIIESLFGNTTLNGGINVMSGSVLLDQFTAPLSGNTTISNGASLQVGSSDSGGVFPPGSLTMNGTLTFNRVDDLPFTKVIAGANTGNLVKNGDNTLTLQAANTFTGTVSIVSGVLKTANTSALGRTNVGTTISSGGTLDVNGLNLGLEAVTAVGQGTATLLQGAIDNSNVTNAIPALSFITLSGDTTFGTSVGRWDLGAQGGPTADPATSQLSTGGNGYKLTKVGSQFFGLRGVTVDPGLGDVDVQAGIFNIEGNTTGLGNPANTVFVRNAASLELYNMTNQLNKHISLDDGSTVINGSGTNLVIGPIALNGNATFNCTGSTGGLILSGQISGSGSLTKIGTNTLTVTSSANNYSGETIVNLGTLALSGSGTVAGSSQITLNGGNVDVTGESSSFTLTPNTLTANSGSTLIVSNQAVTQIGTFNMNNAAIQLPVANGALPSVNASSLQFGGTTNSVNIVLVGTPSQTQFPLVKYSSMSGFNIGVGTILPASAGYIGYITNNTVNGTIDFVLIGSGASAVWNGAAAPNFNWSAGANAGNWNGVALQQGNNLFFAGTVGLNNTNDTTPGSIYAGITFNSGSGAFVLNGNPIALTGNISNNAPSLQALNLGIGIGASSTLNAGTGGLSLAGTLSNNALTNRQDLTLIGNGGSLSSAITSVQGGTLRFNQSAANDSDTWSFLGNASSTVGAGQIQITRGTLNFGSTTDSPSLSITNGYGAGTSEWVMIGNTANSTNTVNIKNGTLTLSAYSANSVDASRRLDIANAGTAIWNQSGGTVTFNFAQAGTYGVFNANNNGTVGTMNLTGGTLDTVGNAPNFTTPFNVSTRGAGTVNLSGTATLKAGALSINRGSGPGGTTNFGTFNLNGGTLQAGSITRGGTAAATGAATFNFNGGVLQALQSSATFWNNNADVTANVQAGGGIIDTAGFDDTIAEVLGHDASLGSTPDGGLTKRGNGALTLANTETYTGPTVVSAGSLALTDAGALPQNTSITVQGGATIDVSGRTDGTLTLNNQTLLGNGTVAGNLVVPTSSTVSPGGSVGVLTITGTATIGGAAIFELNAGLSTNDQLVATSFDCTGGSLLVNNLGGSFTNGQTFKLLSTPASAPFASVTLPSPGPGLGWQTNLTVDGTISLIATGPTTNANITKVLHSGSNLVISGTNNNGGQNFHYVVLSSSSLSVPLANWTPLSTNSFNPDGTFSYTNAIDPAKPHQFLDVKVVP